MATREGDRAGSVADRRRRGRRRFRPCDRPDACCGAGVQPSRNPHQLSAADQAAVVAFVASLGPGPAIPDADLVGAQVAQGGLLFRENCAACHQAGGAGAVLSAGRSAPSLAQTPPTQILEAMIVGPGAMPVFSGLDESDRLDVAAYVRSLGTGGDPGGASLGRVGPVAEGLAVWAAGLAPLVAATWWVTRPKRARRGSPS
ncbi:MAG: cytochrome c [Ilumatobacteraceae bacterium]